MKRLKTRKIGCVLAEDVPNLAPSGAKPHWCKGDMASDLSFGGTLSLKTCDRGYETLYRLAGIFVGIRVVELAIQTSRMLPVRRIAVPLGMGIKLVPVAEIEWIQTTRRHYVRIHLAGQEYIVRAEPSDLVGSLGPQFLRISRSAAVRVDCIDVVVTLPGKRHTVRLRNGVEIPVGPIYWRELRRVISE